MEGLKQKIKLELISKLELELQEIESAALASRAYANQDDLKAESKYDTRAIEATYLAQAQAVRVDELKSDLQMIKDLDVEHVSTHVELGALILIEQNSFKKLHFVSTALGGTILNIAGNMILVISVFSPIGNEALGLTVGESFEVETPKEIRTYKIEEIY